jgi:hypothetical protein
MARALVSARVVVQVFLVVRLGVPPLASLQHLCGNLALVPLLVGLLCNVLGDLLLLLVVVEDATAVLRADVRALAVGGCRIVHAIEVLEQTAVGDLGRVEDDLERFGVCVNKASCQRVLSSARLQLLTSGGSRAHSAIARGLGVATNVANARVQ